MVTSVLTERCTAFASPCKPNPLLPATHSLPQTRALSMCVVPYLGDTVLPLEGKQALPALLAVWFVNFQQDLEKSCV